MIKVLATIVNFIKKKQFVPWASNSIPSYRIRAEISMIQRIVKVTIPQDQRILRDFPYCQLSVIFLFSCVNLVSPLPFPGLSAPIWIASFGCGSLLKGRQLIASCLFLWNGNIPFSSFSTQEKGNYQSFYVAHKSSKLYHNIFTIYLFHNVKKL